MSFTAHFKTKRIGIRSFLFLFFFFFNQKAHKARVTSLYYSLEHDWVLSTSRDKFFSFHSTDNLRRIGSYQINTATTCIAYSKLIFISFLKIYMEKTSSYLKLWHPFQTLLCWRWQWEYHISEVDRHWLRIQSNSKRTFGFNYKFGLGRQQKVSVFWESGQNRKYRCSRLSTIIGLFGSLKFKVDPGNHNFDLVVNKITKGWFPFKEVFGRFYFCLALDELIQYFRFH